MSRQLKDVRKDREIMSRHYGPSSKTQMPFCQYKNACTRKNCVYRHPTKEKKIDEYAEEIEKSICIHYILGSCEYGRACMNHHERDEERRAKIIEKVNNTMCLYGADCLTEGCLYKHPEKINNTLLAFEEPIYYSDQENTNYYYEGIGEHITNHHVMRASALPFVPSFDAKPFVPSFPLPPTSESVHKIFQAPTPQQEKALMTMTNKDSSKTVNATVKIPSQFWLTEAERNPNLYRIEDPFERFTEVNRPFRKKGIYNLIDLHFQTGVQAMNLLSVILDETIDKIEESCLWIITGSGKHTVHGQNAPGKLFRIVKTYLDTKKMDYFVAKDGNHFESAFCVNISK